MELGRQPVGRFDVRDICGLQWEEILQSITMGFRALRVEKHPVERIDAGILLFSERENSSVYGKGLERPQFGNHPTERTRCFFSP